MADADSSKGVLSGKVAERLLPISSDAFEMGTLVDLNQPSSDTPNETIKKLFEGESEETLFVKAHYRPAIYVIRKVHSLDHQGNLPKKFFPLVCPVWVSREGLLYPAGTPHIPRDLLSPQAEDKFTIAELDTHDSFLTLNKLEVLTEDDVLAELKSENPQDRHPAHWQNYYQLCRKMFKETCLTRATAYKIYNLKIS